MTIKTRYLIVKIIYVISAIMLAASIFLTGYYSYNDNLTNLFLSSFSMILFFIVVSSSIIVGKKLYEKLRRKE